MKNYKLLFGILAIFALSAIGIYTLIPSTTVPTVDEDKSEVVFNEELPPMVVPTARGMTSKPDIFVDTEIPTIPGEMMVYKIKNNTATKDDAIEFGKRLGMNGTFKEKDDRFDIIDEPYRLKVNKHPARPGIDYGDMSVTTGREKHSNLPPENEAIDIAKKFLTDMDLMSDDWVFDKVVPGSATGWMELDPETNENVYKEEIHDLAVYFRYELNGIPVIGPGSKMRVNIGNNSDVIGFYKYYGEYEPWRQFEIITPNEAITHLEETGIYSGSMKVKKAKIKDIHIEYLAQPSSGEQEYLQPTYAFDIEIEGTYSGINKTEIERTMNYIPAIAQPDETLQLDKKEEIKEPKQRDKSKQRPAPNLSDDEYEDESQVEPENGHNETMDSLMMPPGLSGLYMAVFMHPHNVDMKAGETKEINLTLETRKDGPGSVTYDVFQVEKFYSDEKISMVGGLNVKVELSTFMAYPNETYISVLKIETDQYLPRDEYFLYIHHKFEGVMSGGGWLSVEVN